MRAARFGNACTSARAAVVTGALWTLIACGLCLSSRASLAQPAGPPSDASGDAQAIEWREDQPLRWSDFRGPVDPDARSQSVAATAASLGWSYAYERIRDNGRCTFRITNVETTAEFQPDESWVKDGHRTPQVLEHEQGHFDLTQVHKLVLDRAVSDLIGPERSCPRRNASMRAIESVVADIVMPIGERVWRELGRAQERYDEETAHGMREDVQRGWTARIERALERGRW